MTIYELFSSFRNSVESGVIEQHGKNDYDVKLIELFCDFVKTKYDLSDELLNMYKLERKFKLRFFKHLYLKNVESVMLDQYCAGLYFIENNNGDLDSNIMKDFVYYNELLKNVIGDNFIYIKNERDHVTERRLGFFYDKQEVENCLSDVENKLNIFFDNCKYINRGSYFNAVMSIDDCLSLKLNEDDEILFLRHYFKYIIPTMKSLSSDFSVSNSSVFKIIDCINDVVFSSDVDNSSLEYLSSSDNIIQLGKFEFSFKLIDFASLLVLYSSICEFSVSKNKVLFYELLKRISLYFLIEEEELKTLLQWCEQNVNIDLSGSNIINGDISDYIIKLAPLLESVVSNKIDKLSFIIEGISNYESFEKILTTSRKQEIFVLLKLLNVSYDLSNVDNLVLSKCLLTTQSSLDNVVKAMQ